MRICRDCRQEIPRNERPEDHLCIGDREPDTPDEDDEGELLAGTGAALHGVYVRVG